MYIAVDIGAYKTTVFSTDDGGSVVFDEFGKREFSTVLALTTPLRTFGKAVSGDSPQQMLLRRRGFFHAIKDAESQKYILMYLNYISRMIKSKYDSVVIVVPEHFGEEEKAVLRALANASQLRVGGFLTHLTGIASCAVLRNLSHPERFAIFDFGFHKSAAGLFEFKDNRLVPLQRRVVKRGASDFDGIIYGLLRRKYGLKDDAVTRERLFQVVGSMKRGLNQLESVSASIFGENFENIKMELTRAEFLAEAAPIIGEISSFVDGFVTETGTLDHVQVVGNNYNSAVVQDIMKVCPHATVLHPSESAALGACLAFGMNERKTKYRVEEICGSEISVRVVESAQDAEANSRIKPTLVFKKNALRDSIIGVNYNRKKAFLLEVLEDGRVFGVVRINKDESETAEKVKVKFRIDNFGMLEVCGAYVQPAEEGADPKTVDTAFDSYYAVSEEHLASVKAADDEYAVQENDFRRAGEARHATETYIDTFASVIDKNFPGLLTPEDRDKIEGFADGIFGKSGGNLEAETALRKQLLEDLEFVGEKLAVEQRLLEAQLKELLDKLAPYVEECKDSGDYNMHRLKLSVASWLKSLNLDLENFANFDRAAYDQLKSNVETSVAMKEFVKKSKSESAGGSSCEASCGCGHGGSEPGPDGPQDACCGHGGAAGGSGCESSKSSTGEERPL